MNVSVNVYTCEYENEAFEAALLKKSQDPVYIYTVPCSAMVSSNTHVTWCTCINQYGFFSISARDAF